MISLNDFSSLRPHIPLIDVRSPKEFTQGHIPGAINIPLLDDDERAAVGTAYKREGKAVAIRLGFKLVGPRLYKMISQTDKIANDKGVLVYCWRGGMRSGNFCQFMEMAGIKAQRLEGGYKAWRQQGFKSFSLPWKIVRLGGCTGSGKSEILRALEKSGEQILDLEGLANHRGSAFGGLMMPPQPTTEQFQNILFENLNTLDITRRLWVEDESMAIGLVSLPAEFWAPMIASAVVEIVLDRNSRIERIVNEYGQSDSEAFLAAIDRISKRLGGLQHKQAKDFWIAGNKFSCIDVLLNYYDKLYLKGLDNKNDKIISRLSWDGKHTDDIVSNLKQFIFYNER